jgi:N-acetyldiaminopimelate deacetylase
VVSVGSLEAKGSAECVPDAASCDGVLHTFDEKLRGRVKEMIVGAVQEIEYKRTVEISARFNERYPCVENDKRLAYEAMLLADSNGYKVKDLDRCYVADDFGYLAQQYPSLLYHLGTGSGSNCSHCAGSQIEDRVLEIGQDFMSQLALNILNR